MAPFDFTALFGQATLAATPLAILVLLVAAIGGLAGGVLSSRLGNHFAGKAARREGASLVPPAGLPVAASTASLLSTTADLSCLRLCGVPVHRDREKRHAAFLVPIDAPQCAAAVVVFATLLVAPLRFDALPAVLCVVLGVLLGAMLCADVRFRYLPYELSATVVAAGFAFQAAVSSAPSLAFGVLFGAVLFAVTKTACVVGNRCGREVVGGGDALAFFALATATGKASAIGSLVCFAAAALWGLACRRRLTRSGAAAKTDALCDNGATRTSVSCGAPAQTAAFGSPMKKSQEQTPSFPMAPFLALWFAVFLIA